MPDVKRDTWSDWPLIPLFSLIHLLLTGALGLFAFCALGSATLWDVFVVLNWVLLFPMMVAGVCGLHTSAAGWWVLNSLLYGVIWWFTWRMYKVLFRAGSKREG